MNARTVAVTRSWIGRFLHFEHEDIQPLRPTPMDDDIGHYQTFAILVLVICIFIRQSLALRTSRPEAFPSAGTIGASGETATQKKTGPGTPGARYLLRRRGKPIAAEPLLLGRETMST
jgi:hypothetical protein